MADININDYEFVKLPHGLAQNTCCRLACTKTAEFTAKVKINSMDMTIPLCTQHADDIYKKIPSDFVSKYRVGAWCYNSKCTDANDCMITLPIDNELYNIRLCSNHAVQLKSGK